MPIIIETRDEFDAKHGARLYTNNRWLHADGAQQDEHGSQRLLPPENELACCLLVVEYYEAKVESLAREYRAAKESLAARANMAVQSKKFTCVIPPSDEEFRWLTTQERRIANYKVLLRRHQREAKRLRDPEGRLASLAEADNTVLQRNKDMHAKIINLPSH